MHSVSCCLRMLEISWLRFERGGARRCLQISAQELLRALPRKEAIFGLANLIFYCPSRETDIDGTA